MKALLRPELCAYCGQALLYIPHREAKPFIYTACCKNADCAFHGFEFKLPELECEPYPKAALLRRKVGLA